MNCFHKHSGQQITFFRAVIWRFINKTKTFVAKNWSAWGRVYANLVRWFQKFRIEKTGNASLELSLDLFLFILWTKFQSLEKFGIFFRNRITSLVCSSSNVSVLCVYDVWVLWRHIIIINVNPSFFSIMNFVMRKRFWHFFFTFEFLFTWIWTMPILLRCFKVSNWMHFGWKFQLNWSFPIFEFMVRNFFMALKNWSISLSLSLAVSTEYDEFYETSIKLPLCHLGWVPYLRNEINFTFDHSLSLPFFYYCCKLLFCNFSV